MNNFHEWVKQNHPEELKEFFGANLMARPQTGQMQTAMNYSTNAAGNMAGGQGNYKKVGWLLNMSQQMLGNDKDMLNYFIRSLLGMRKNAMTQPINPASPIASQI